ncbi:M15 family metallopeptidase [Paenibacillus cisolokensis]|uniref:M15 family metallopeptidase n=1 Tax=Paenibacillus cisolokensis TaxID=1658519 RepID=UPI003D283FBC
MSARRTSWTTLLLSSLLVAGMVLAGCQSKDAGSGQEQGQELQSPAGEQQENTIPEGEAGADDVPSDPVMAKRTENALQATVKEEGGKQVVINAEAIPVVVNKQRSLPDGYAPSDLVEPNVPFSFDEAHEKRHMRREAAEALEELFAAAQADGIELRAVSGYRSYERQKVIYENNVRTKGEEEALRVSAVPGTSEHQTGLAIDVSSPSVGNALEEVFGRSAEGRWLAEHAVAFGFIIRYPEGKEGITGYVYEPWHIRYVGKDLAPDIADSGLTLEEYFDESNIKL